MEAHSDLSSTEGGSNTSEQQTRTNNNQTTTEWTERTKQIQNTNSIAQKNGPHEDQSKDVMGADIGVYTFDIQPKP